MSRDPSAEFDNETKTRALIACKRHCVLCENFVGAKMTCHHIVAVADGGDGSYENCLPLCLNCHGEVRHYDPRHPVGLKYRPEELRRRRDDFYLKVGQVNDNSDDFLATDRATLLGILAALPSDSEDIRMLKNHDFGGAFRWSSFERISTLVANMNGPEHEFLNAELETKRIEFVGSQSAFLSKAANFTVPDVNGWVYVNAEKHGPNYRRMASEIDNFASQAHEAYVGFVRYARRRLRI